MTALPKYMDIKVEVITDHNRLHELGWEWYRTDPPVTTYTKKGTHETIQLFWPLEVWWSESERSLLSGIETVRKHNANVMTSAETEDVMRFCV